MLAKVLVALAVALACAKPVPAADIVEAPELEPRLAKLRSLYGGGEWYTDEAGTPKTGSVLGNEADAWAKVQFLRLTGVIEPGDAARLRAFFEDPAYYRRYVVMDSPGGSFTEGLRIGDVLREYRQGQDIPALGGVVVLSGERCLSACALAFAMAAVTRDVGGSVRYLEDGAELGFHMGFLPDRLADQTAAVRDAMNLGYDVSERFLQLMVDGVSPPELLANALKHRSADSFYFVGANYEARFMGFTPVSAGVAAAPAYANALSKHQMNSICIDMYLSAPGQRLSPAMKEFVDVNLETPGLYEVTEFEAFIEALGGRSIVSPYCAVHVDASDRIWIKMNGLDGLRASCDAGAEALASKGWCATRADTQNHAFSAVTVAQLSVALGCSDGTLDQRWDQASQSLGETWQASVRRRVTLRAEPSLSGARLGRLEPGETSHVIGCRQVADRQGVWYQVQAKGQTGWVSARFLGL